LVAIASKNNKVFNTKQVLLYVVHDQILLAMLCENFSLLGVMVWCNDQSMSD